MSKTQENTVPSHLKEHARLDERYELKRIQISTINKGHRVRGDVGSEKQWNAFKENIQKRGLLHPIAVMQYAEPVSNFEYFLLAGGRRLQAHIELGQDEIAAKVYPPDLSALEIEAIELEENLHRKDLTVSEELEKVKRLHNLYSQIHGTKTSTAPDAEGWSIRDTASLMGVSPTIISQDLQAAAVLELYPKLAEKVQNKTELKRIIKKAEKSAAAKQRIKEIEESVKDTTIDMIREKLVRSYVTGDFLEKVKKLPSDSFGFINLDPDYPMDISEDDPTQPSINLAMDLGEYHGKSPEEYEAFMVEALKETYRVAKEEAWLIIWFGYEYFQRILDWCEEAGWETNFRHGHWDKGTGHTRVYERYLKHRGDPFIYARTGRSRIYKSHYESYDYPSNHPSKRINPFEKPVALMQDILSTFVPVGTRILDCCTGSGNLLLAGNNYRCSGVGFDPSVEQREQFMVKVFEQEPLHYQ